MLIQKINENKLLRRVYTQNVDAIEDKLNLSKNQLIYCHGKLTSFRCTKCVFPVDYQQVTTTIKEGQLPLCASCQELVRVSIIVELFNSTSQHTSFSVYQNIIKYSFDSNFNDSIF